jgi:cysteine desulfurase
LPPFSQRLVPDSTFDTTPTSFAYFCLMQTVYFDNAATTRLDDRVLDAMLPFLRDSYGNASSAHQLGQLNNVAVEEARERIATLFKVTPAEIIFTSGGTESNNAVIQGVRAATSRTGFVSSAAEHHAVLTPLEHLQKKGFPVSLIIPGPTGVVSPELLKSKLSGNTALVSLMAVNNETGAQHDLPALIEAAHAAGAHFHTDAVQAAGKFPFDLNALPIDFMSVSAHKFYGPKGIGFLFVRAGSDWEPWMEGGSQERRRRGGTLNVPGIIGLAKALELAYAELDETKALISALKSRFVSGLISLFGQTVSFNGSPEQTSYNIVNISFVEGDEGILDGEMLLLNLDMEGICVSNGSACTSGAIEPSHVLTAMGRTESAGKSSVRFSFGKYNTVEEIDLALDKLHRIVSRMTRSRRG